MKKTSLKKEVFFVFPYVKSFFAATPEELEEQINAFIADPAFVTTGIEFITPIDGSFGAYIMYRLKE